jgi:hypothetical protein
VQARPGQGVWEGAHLIFTFWTPPRSLYPTPHTIPIPGLILSLFPLLEQANPPVALSLPLLPNDDFDCHVSRNERARSRDPRLTA